MEYRDGIFDCSLRCSTLYCIDYNTFSLFACSEPCFIHYVIDIRLSLASCLCLHIVQELVLCFGCCHACDFFNLPDGIGAELVVLFAFLVCELNLILQGFPDCICFLLLATKLGILLIQSVFLLFQTALNVTDLIVFLVDVLLMLAFELEEFFLGLKDFLFLDAFSFDFCFLDDFLFLSLQ